VSPSVPSDPERIVPPAPRLAFRVGVVGHRPDRLREADLAVLDETLRVVLATVRDTVVGALPRWAAHYTPEPPILRAISPLAEGTDRMFARAALGLGYELCCPMPFHQPEYERDFSSPTAAGNGSLEEFRQLLETARAGTRLTTFELSGSRADAGAAYAAAGRIVLTQSDLLVVVWDGTPGRGRGGTADTLLEALRSHMSVLWIDAVSPHRWQFLRSEDELPGLASGVRCTPRAGAPPLEELMRTVRGVIAWPRGAEGRTGTDAERLDRQQLRHSVYLRERRPRWNPAFVWKLFRDLVGSLKPRVPSFRVMDFEQAVADKWPVAPGPEATELACWVNRRLRPHYAWSDKPADLHADAYRSGFVLMYLLAALAVLLALLPGAMGWDRHADPRRAACVVAEFAIVASILGSFYWARRQRLHTRWMDYRMLAELIRQMRFQIPLGGVRPQSPPPAHLSAYGDPSMTWMYWHATAVERAIGLPSARVDHDYLVQYLDYFHAVLVEQIGFHDGSGQRSKRIEHRLHRSVRLLLLLTLGCIVVHFAPFGSLVGLPALSLRGRLEEWLTLGCAFLPALGAALAGINEQGEFARLAKRGGAMHERLDAIRKDVEDMKRAADPETDPLRLEQVQRLVEPTARLMVDEVLDWRVIFRDRPPTIPA
jgi:hypothetical protein